MNRMKSMTLALAAAGIAFTAAIAPASAACKLSVWSKTSGDSFADSIEGRDCNGKLSVRFSGTVGSTNWLAMHRTGLNKLRTTFVDAHITTKVRMKTNVSKMSVAFKHKESSGTKSKTYGTYELISMQ